MICLDSNIIIYFAKKTLREDFIGNETMVYASISRIEVLGYKKILSVEEDRSRDFLAKFTEVPLENSIIERAVHLRQQKNMSLGDAIIAATALENDCVLWTANTDDFEHIEDLKIFNPLNN